MNIGLVRNEVLDECGTSRAAIDLPSQFGVERDGPIQQQLGGACVLEMARVHQRFVHRGKIVRIRIQTCANAFDVAERGKELERSGQKNSTVKEIDQNLSTRSDEPIAY